MGIIFCFIMEIILSIQPIADNDYFWHTIIGKWVDINKSIPTKPLFTWFGTEQKYSWTSHEWLTEFIMYKIGDIGSLIIMILIFIGLYYLMYKLLKIDFKKLFDVKLLYLLLMTIFFKVTGPRPYIISLLFFAYFVYVLFNYIDKDTKYFSKLIYTLPVVQFLWVNLHGGSSSLQYLFIIIILVLEFILKKFNFKEKRWSMEILNKNQQYNLVKVLILILIASLFNPTTYNILLYPFTNMLDTNMLELILEWNSPSFHGLLGLYIFIMIAYPLFNMILSDKKYKLHEVFILALMLYMSLKSQRFIGMYGIYSTYLIGKYSFVTKDMYEIFRKPFKKYEKLITNLFVTLLVLIVIVISKNQINKFKTVIDKRGYYSDQAIEHLIKLKPKRLFNEYGAGGYLIYKLDKMDALNDIPIFTYGIGDVFSKNSLPDSKKLENLLSDPKIIIDKYNFDVMIVTSEAPLQYYLNSSNEWKIHYQDNTCLIYVKSYN